MMIEYKTATHDDLPKIVDIYNESIPGKLATADLEPVTVDDREEWFQQHNDKRPLQVILVDDKIAGWISLSSFYGRPAYHETVEVSIYIDNGFQHQGLGQQAIDHVISLAPSIGVHSLLAFIFGHNTASRKLFERNGFEQCGHLPKIADMDGIDRDLEIYGLHVG
ncbi:GNAT family N-acetyltransferase [Pediococcus argentinicus]|nr:GNAT family N-acetyltransferase [Pediococcus argentinicus]NKZ22040.1 N-acetyltransferase [Pediococcus argentinicus]GEP19379.1 N-acetyltransferase [Pediococcus argentinicus]